VKREPPPQSSSETSRVKREGRNKGRRRTYAIIAMGRAPCCDKATVKKGPWSPEEDAKLKSYIEQNGTGGNWIALPQKIGTTSL
jgi:hypothetical protein